MEKQKSDSSLATLGKALFTDISHFILKRPLFNSLITFDSPSAHQNFSARILQRLNVNVDNYSILNIHKIGINAPGKHVFEELLSPDNHSRYWPNNLAHVKLIDGLLNHIQVHLFGVEKIFNIKKLGLKGLSVAPLFILKKRRFNFTPQTLDLDNARSLLYDCSGGYPIGIFSFYVRSSIIENNEKESSQLFFMVAFDFFGMKKGLVIALLRWLWEKIHNRVTANVLNSIKIICERSMNR